MNKTQADIVVVGAGPGGYAAAFYAADRGLDVILVEKSELGGVCLNRGCIPSKALLHATEILSEAKEAEEIGITFEKPKLDLDKLREWKNGILHKLTSGVAGLAKKKGVKVIKGKGHFEDKNLLRVETESGQQFIEFKNAIIAVGSKPAIPAAFDLGNKRIMTSTEALEIADIPKTLLVVGGGYIGMELGTVYAKLGSDVVLAEANESILMGADADLVRPVKKFADKHFKEQRYGVKVKSMKTSGKKISVTIEKDGKSTTEDFDKVLVSIGRTPNSKDLGLENTGVTLDGRGFIEVNDKLETKQANIYAIGDIIGGVMLAHKASKEAKIAVDNILGEPHTANDILIPAVVFTDPEVAWVGVTQNEAKEKGLDVDVAKFPWGASGRAMTLNSTDGLTKIIVDKQTQRVIGMGIVGAGAGDMISEGTLAIEMGATVDDIALTIHPHPTLSETIMESAEAYLGHSTHVHTPKKH